jgi:hypothetical protein
MHRQTAAFFDPLGDAMDTLRQIKIGNPDIGGDEIDLLLET